MTSAREALVSAVGQAERAHLVPALQADYLKLRDEALLASRAAYPRSYNAARRAGRRGRPFFRWLSCTEHGTGCDAPLTATCVELCQFEESDGVRCPGHDHGLCRSCLVTKLRSRTRTPEGRTEFGRELVAAGLRCSRLGCPDAIPLATLKALLEPGYGGDSDVQKLRHFLREWPPREDELPGSVNA